MYHCAQCCVNPVCIITLKTRTCFISMLFRKTAQTSVKTKRELKVVSSSLGISVLGGVRTHDPLIKSQLMLFYVIVDYVIKHYVNQCFKKYILRFACIYLSLFCIFVCKSYANGMQI